MTPDPLRDELADIATLLEPAGISLILGGGYGLVLRGRLLDAERRASRYELRLPTRATADLDLFLSVAILTDPSKTKRIAEVLHERGFPAVEHNWQFAKPIGASGAPRQLTVDLLGADVPEELGHLMHHSNDDRRIRPEGFAGLHARRVPEAVSIERYATKIDVSTDSNPVFVLLPHPISFLLMKLAAFRDRIEHADDERKERAAYHAFDVFNTLATMSAAEWSEARGILSAADVIPVANEARAIAAEYFGTARAPGVIAMFDYVRTQLDSTVSLADRERFVKDLRDLLFVADGASSHG